MTKQNQNLLKGQTRRMVFAY
ncbi:hypothetical protein EMIT048CA2_300011 [Pseudomonas chlororaphis]